MARNMHVRLQRGKEAMVMGTGEILVRTGREIERSKETYEKYLSFAENTNDMGFRDAFRLLANEEFKYLSALKKKYQRLMDQQRN